MLFDVMRIKFHKFRVSIVVFLLLYSVKNNIDRTIKIYTIDKGTNVYLTYDNFSALIT